MIARLVGAPIVTQSSELSIAQAEVWRQRAARYRTLSALLGKTENDGRLLALAIELESRASDRARMTAERQDLKSRTQVLLAEVDAFLTHAQATLAQARRLVPPSRYRAEDVREESRLCREEAATAEQVAAKRAVASRAFALAQLAERMDRDAAEAP
jgi:hypothetical protein